MTTKDPKPIHDAKSMARSLRDALAARNVALSHSECLEIVARQLGFADWNTLSAKLSTEEHAPGEPKRAADPAPAAAAVDSHSGTTVAVPRAGTALERVPVVALRDVVVYPGVVIPLYAARPRTVRAMEVAAQGDKLALLLTQRRTADDDPGAQDLYGIGTFASVLEVLKLPNGTWKLLVSGVARARVDAIEVEEHLSARITVLSEVQARIDPRLQPLRQAVSSRFEQYARRTGWPHVPGRVESDPAVRTQILASFALLDDSRFADTIAAHSGLPLAQKQQLLEMLEARERLAQLEAALPALEPDAAPDPVLAQP
jgi:uncharacterized protein